MCSAVCQQFHSRLPACTDQSRSVRGSRPLTMHAIAASRSPAVTVMMLRAYDYGRPQMRGSPVVTPIRAFWSGLSRSGAVLVVTADPGLGIALGRLVAPPGREVEELIGAVDRVDAAGVRRVRVEHLALSVLDEGADPLAVLQPGRGYVVVDRGPFRYRVRRERDAEVVVEVRLARRIPGEGPAHPLLVGRKLGQRRPGDRREGRVPSPEVNGRAVEAVRPERAVRAPRVPVRREHEVVDDEPPAAVEQVTQGAFPGRAVEDVLLGHRLPGQAAAVAGEGLALAGELLLPGPERLAGLDPLVVGHHRVLGRHRDLPCYRSIISLNISHHDTGHGHHHD